MTATAAVLERVRRGWAPPTDLTVSEFSDQELVVTTGPLAGTHWQTNFAPYQRGILDAFHEPGVEIAVVMGSSQWGKALAVDTPLATPDGWTTMERVTVGDRVFSETGAVCRVIGATDVMADHPCFSVRFSDGSSIVADADHRWFVESDTPLQPGNSWQGPGPRQGVLTTAKIASTWQWHASAGRKPRHRYAIPVAKALELPARDLPVDPYVLGIWLGDGHVHTPGRLTFNVQDADEILQSFRQAGVTGRVSATKGGAATIQLASPMSSRLRQAGVIPKCIPAPYLRASIAQRRALLQGLMDSDGAIDRDGASCEFTTTVEALSAGVGELLLSLGLKHHVRQFVPRIQYRGRTVTCAPVWRFDFTAYEDAEIFRLQRKRRRLPSRVGRRTSETERRRIVGVESTASVPVKCIAVDSPTHLYLAGHAMIPTHNTACAVNVVSYHIAYDPCPILVVEPTVDPMAKDFARNRLEPVIAASPILRDTVSKKRAKDASNTQLLKTFRGGFIAIAGANSAASLAARPARLLVMDEIDRYPAELPGEGSTISIALKRTTAYRHRRRVLMLSSPTLRDAPIHAWYQRGDQRRFYVPCPSCGHRHPFTWKQVRWQHGDPSTARLHCPSCDHAIDDAERVSILADGEWCAEAPKRLEKNVVSFHLWEAYSPLSSLTEIVTGFLQARAQQKAGDRSEMHTWQNTTLGEPIEPDAGEGVESSGLLLRREKFAAPVPAGASCLTMGVDTQDDRLEVLVIGWGPGEEAWLVHRDTLPGDTSQPEPWTMLDELLGRQYRHATDERLVVQAMCIDSGGHRTNFVYDYALKNAARRVYAIIGRDGQRPIVSSPSPRRWGRSQRKVPLYTIGVDAAKALLISRLRVTEAGPGYVHLPQADWCDDELAAQLTSERLTMRWTRGVPRQVWVKTRARNEGLDCAIYALGALRLLNPDLGGLLEQLTGRAPAPARESVPKRKWVRKPRRGWLKGRRR